MLKLCRTAAIGVFTLFASVAAFALPVTPTGFMGVAVDTGIQLSWNEDENMTYRVYRGGSEIINGITETEYLDTDIVDDLLYQYFLVGCDEIDECSFGTITINILSALGDTGGGGGGEPMVCPGPSMSSEHVIPQNVMLADNDGVIQMTWLPPMGSTKWNVYRNDTYEFTILNGIPRYDVENYIPAGEDSDGDQLYVTAVYPDDFFGGDEDEFEDISNRSEIAVFAPDVCAEIQASLMAENDALQVEIDELNIQVTDLMAANAALQDMIDNPAEPPEPPMPDDSVDAATHQAVLDMNAELITANETLTADLAACQSDNPVEPGDGPTQQELDDVIAERDMAQGDLVVAQTTIGEQTTIIGDLTADLQACLDDAEVLPPPPPTG